MTVDWKKKLLPNLPYLLFVYLFDKLCQAVRLAPGLNASEKFLHLSQGFTEAFSSGLPSLHLLDLLVGIAGAVIVRLAVYAKGKNARKYRKGIEYGSARWGTAADIAPYVDPVPDWNIPLTQTEKLTMSSRPKNPKYARNKNILVIGGSGSGKTRFFVKPSLMQMHSSYVVTDPKGQLLSEVGTMLRRGAPKLDENGKPMRDARGKVIYEPYRIKVLNTINFKKSMKYNPFAYIRSEKDILKLVNVIIANTKGDGEKSSEDFWVKAERLLYCALIGYIWYEAEPEEKNFLTLLELINASEAREDDEEFQSPVDILFSKLEKEHPDHFAVKQYRKFKLAAGKTLKSILIIKELGKQLKKIGMLVVQDAVWNRVTINREQRKSTRYYILNLHVQPKGFHFLLQHGKVGRQVKVQILRFQRKIQILGKAVETVEDSQGGSAVERRFFEEARTGQAAEHNFLHDLLHGVLSVVDILYMVAFQHLFNGAVHVKASLKASRASLRSWNDTLRCICKPYFRPASQSPIPQSANPPSAAGKAPVCSVRAA